MSGQSFGGVTAQEFGDRRLVDPALYDFQNEVRQFRFIDMDLNVVQFEKHDCCCCSNPFVAIQKWVILNEVKQVAAC